MKQVSVVVLAVVGLVLLGSVAVRQAEGHNWFPDDGCAPGTSPDGYFWAAGPASGWFVVYNYGWNGCNVGMFSKASTTLPVNYAEWYLPISSNYTHTYKLQA